MSSENLNPLIDCLKKNIETPLFQEKIVAVLGVLGGKCQHDLAARILEILWDKAHDERLGRSMLDHIFQNYYRILNIPGFPCDVLKRDYCLKCLGDLQRKQGSVIPAIKYFIEILGHEPTFPSVNIESDLICLVVSKHDLILILLQSVYACQLDWWNKTHDHANMDTPVNERVTHEESIQNHLDLLSLLLKKGNLFLLLKRGEELWDALIADERASSLERDLGFSWFIYCIEDLSQETQCVLFQKRVDKLDLNHLSPKGHECFKLYSERCGQPHD